MAQIWLTFMAHLFILAHLAHFEPDLKQTDKPTNKATDNIPNNQSNFGSSYHTWSLCKHSIKERKGTFFFDLFYMKKIIKDI